MQLKSFTLLALAALFPTILAKCESNNNHHTGTSCHGATGNSACDGGLGGTIVSSPVYNESQARRGKLIALQVTCNADGTWHSSGRKCGGQNPTCFNCDCIGPVVVAPPPPPK